MKTSKTGINIIKQFEGFSAKPYLCSGGFWTIGYGHKIINTKFNIITEEYAEELLLQDLLYSELSVTRNIKYRLNQNQFDALVSLTFNIGGAALQRSTLRQKINKQELTYIRQEFLRWNKAGGKIILGLIIRRNIEAQLFLNKSVLQLRS